MFIYYIKLYQLSNKYLYLFVYSNCASLLSFGRFYHNHYISNMPTFFKNIKRIIFGERCRPDQCACLEMITQFIANLFWIESTLCLSCETQPQNVQVMTDVVSFLSPFPPPTKQEINKIIWKYFLHSFLHVCGLNTCARFSIYFIDFYYKVYSSKTFTVWRPCYKMKYCIPSRSDGRRLLLM